MRTCLNDAVERNHNCEYSSVFANVLVAKNRSNVAHKKPIVSTDTLHIAFIKKKKNVKKEKRECKLSIYVT